MSGWVTGRHGQQFWCVGCPFRRGHGVELWRAVGGRHSARPAPSICGFPEASEFSDGIGARRRHVARGRDLSMSGDFRKRIEGNHWRRAFMRR